MATKAAPGKRALILGAPRQGALFRPNSSVGKLSFSLSLPFPTAAELMSKLLRVVALRWSRGIPGGEELRNRNIKLQPGPKKSLPQKFARERGRGESHPDRECKCDAHSPKQRQRERKAQVSQRHRLLGHTGSNSCLSSRMFSAYFKINFVYPAKLVQSASIASAGHHRHSTMGSSSVGSSNNGAHAPWSASGSDEPGSGGEHTASRYRTPMTASSMRASRRRLNRRSVMPVTSDHSQLSDQVDEGVSFQAVCAVNANTPPSWRGVLALHADRKARRNDNAVVMRVDVAAVSTLRDGEVRVFISILSLRIRAPRPSQLSD